MTVIALPAAGAMGAGLGCVLAAHGATVLTMTEGRSEATRHRAEQAGMRPASLNELARADLILSVVPPAIAVTTAGQIIAALPGGHRPIYADLNAISPDRSREIADIVAGHADFVDGGIIGAPPRADSTGGPLIYLSGNATDAASLMVKHGLKTKVIDGGIGAASAVKMCYGAMTKGITGLTSAMLLAAERAGIGEVLHAELSRSQSQLLTRSEQTLPDMYGKAYRWVDEMDQIAAFLTPERPESQIWQGLARFYQMLADDEASDKSQVSDLDHFLKRREKTLGNSSRST
ncbi:NAD(P)-dependent oxidoreductase [Paracoccus tegillarcae]|uniref:6-phosphogluconate dehydrogenase n=1 Tax=Paracoccus tegillarcae TaxID=1529068 RepID=A0A2K9EFV7_9RHOB|nr:NAD(P)-dependent oxidoreductase [Paracoccus tegillarcae]AUH33850.1 6-phosphogluconate dehydrogenase [Paracoccus tegillarcae]